MKHIFTHLFTHRLALSLVSALSASVLPASAIAQGTEGRVVAQTVFAFWDRDGDGVLVAPEMRRSMSAGFRRADFDADGFLTQDEFIQGVPIMIAMRAAIRPDL